MFKYRSLTTVAIAALIAFGFYVAVYLKAVWTGSGNPHLFFHPDNLTNLLGQASIVGILACGMTLVIVSGHVDLSVGSMLGMLGAAGALLISAERGPGIPDLAAVVCVIALGALIGFGQGALVAWRRVPAFVVTLGGLLVFRGILLILAKSTIPVGPGLINFLGSGTYKGMPVRFALMTLLAVAIHLLASHFRFGRYVYAIGGNREAARFSGIRVEWHIALVFALMGGVAGLAGLVYSGVQMAADAGAGELLELYAIAACVIGGTSLSGGKGTVFGSVCGAVIMATIRNGLSCLGVASAGEKIILGVILIAAVGFDAAFSERGKK